LIDLKSNLSEIITELENLSPVTSNSGGVQNAPYASSSSGNSLSGGGGGGGSSELENKIIEQNKDLIKTIKKLTGDKIEMRNLITRLEEEIWNYKNKYKSEINTLTEHDREKVRNLF
jgi:hypothetical protein